MKYILIVIRNLLVAKQRIIKIPQFLYIEDMQNKYINMILTNIYLYSILSKLRIKIIISPLVISFISILM